MSAAANTSRSVTAPVGPTESNRWVARAAPHCTETAAVATRARAGGCLGPATFVPRPRTLRP